MKEFLFVTKSFFIYISYGLIRPLLRIIPFHAFCNGVFCLLFYVIFEHIMFILQSVNENDIHNIVLSYLVHNCFKDTLESFVASTGVKQPVHNLEDMEKRKSKGVPYLLVYGVQLLCELDFWINNL